MRGEAFAAVNVRPGQKGSGIRAKVFMTRGEVRVLCRRGEEVETENGVALSARARTHAHRRAHALMYARTHTRTDRW
jgi:hypothetical protein